VALIFVVVECPYDILSMIKEKIGSHQKESAPFSEDMNRELGAAPQVQKATYRPAAPRKPPQWRSREETLRAQEAGRQAIAEERANPRGIYGPTRSMAFGEGETDFGMTYSQLFTSLLKTNYNIEFENLKNWLNPNYTYIFELCSKYNRIVTPYETDDIYLLAIRDKKTGDYKPDTYISEDSFLSQFSRPERYHCNSITDVMNKISKLEPLEEGYVAFDPMTNKRVKIKNPCYVAIHKLRFSVTPKSIIELVVNNEIKKPKSGVIEFPEK
jgi:hypothetical protein